MEMYFIEIVNLTGYECSDFKAHYNDYNVMQESLKQFIEDCENKYDEFTISFGESYWENGILIDNWLEAEKIDILK